MLEYRYTLYLTAENPLNSIHNVAPQLLVELFETHHRSLVCCPRLILPNTWLTHVEDLLPPVFSVCYDAIG